MIGEPGRGLQIGTFTFFLPTPTTSPNIPTQMCPHDTGQAVNTAQQIDPANACHCPAILIECKNRSCARILRSPAYGVLHDYPTCDVPGLEKASFEIWCQTPAFTGTGTGIYCVGKPVIYLYPEVVTNVDVTVTTPGKIVVSDPVYPDGGWKNVEAHPDGKLIYNEKEYKELFYESEIQSFVKPTTGVIIPISKIEQELAGLLYQLGLNSNESREFLDFWTPKLRDLKSNYILFSVLEKEAKEKIDHVEYSPEPETRIEFIAYFKPLDIPESTEALFLPKRPERVGFTAVEWGGVIDNPAQRD